MRSRFERIADRVIREAILDHWGLDLGELRYFPEGGGAYHWIGRSPDETRWFVTVDDLDTKPWLGGDRSSVFDGLVACYRAAMELRASGLAFVAAPEATTSGEPAERLDDRHSLSVLRYIDGDPGQWGQVPTSSVIAEVVAMLSRLHLTVAPLPVTAERGLDVPGRADLGAALGDLDKVWTGGPLSESARRELRMHAEDVRTWLSKIDSFAAQMAERATAPVLTHGEPHPGNLIDTGTGLVLLDWDTVAMAPPERDLWMIRDTAEGLASYRALTGVTPDAEALAAYRLLWALADVAAFVVQLRREHRSDADAHKALDSLRSILEGREPWPYGSARGKRPCSA